MKMTKRIFSLALCLVLMLALALPAMAADETYTLTINNTAPGHTYEAYQIFSGDLATNDAGQTVLSSIQWGEGISDGNALLAAINSNPKLAVLHGCTSASALATELAKLISGSETVDEFAEVVGQYLTTPSGSSKKGDDEQNPPYTVEGLEAGYYLIKDKDGTLNGAAHDSYTQYIIRVLKDETVETKGEVPDVDKTINDTLDGTYTEYDSFDINDTVFYKWEGKLPSNLKSYNVYKYKFIDTLPTGIVYERIEKIYIEDNDDNVVHTFYDVSDKPNEKDPDDGVLATEKKYDADNNVVKDEKGNEVTAEIVLEKTENGITVDFEDLMILYPQILDNHKIIVKYTARVTRDALIKNAMTNTVKVEYSNNPNGDGDGKTGTTPPDVAHAFTFELGVNKYDADSEGTKLEGAEFVLYYEKIENIDDKDVVVKYYALVITEEMVAAGKVINGVQVEAKDVGVVYGWTTTESEASVLDTDGNGRISLRGLDADTYFLKETKAPEGYNLMPDPVQVVIKAEYEETTDDVTATVTYKVGNKPEQSSSVVDVPNSAGSTLPSTGGVGTTMFYVVGGLLIAAAVVMLISKRRVEE